MKRILVDPSIRLIVSRRLEAHVLRAVVRSWPGGAPELLLQRIDFGDETGDKIVRETVVDHNAMNHIDAATWDDQGLTFSEGSAAEGERVKTWFVRASSDRFETKAIKA